ncbi:hypothetical protein [Nocardioides montaniterrae]
MLKPASRSLAVLLALLVVLAAFALAPASGAVRTPAQRTLAPYQQALRNAEIPASCGHPAAHLDGYQQDWGMNGSARLRIGRAIHGHVTGHSGWVTAVPMDCNAGGVGLPQIVLLYGAHAHLLVWKDLSSVPAAQENEATRKLAFVDGKVRFLFDGYDGCCFMHSVHRGTLGIAAGHRTWRYAGPLIVTNDDTDRGTITGPNQGSWAFAPAPTDLRAFGDHVWNKEQAAATKYGCDNTPWVALERYSHHGFAMGDVGSCGGYLAIWAKVSGRWRQVLGMQDSPMCASLSRLQRRALTVLAQSCYRDTTSSPVNLGTWPRSGM